MAQGNEMESTVANHRDWSQVLADRYSPAKANGDNRPIVRAEAAHVEPVEPTRITEAPAAPKPAKTTSKASDLFTKEICQELYETLMVQRGMKFRWVAANNGYRKVSYDTLLPIFKEYGIPTVVPKGKKPKSKKKPARRKSQPAPAPRPRPASIPAAAAQVAPAAPAPERVVSSIHPTPVPAANFFGQLGQALGPGVKGKVVIKMELELEVELE